MYTKAKVKQITEAQLLNFLCGVVSLETNYFTNKYQTEICCITLMKFRLLPLYIKIFEICQKNL